MKMGIITGTCKKFWSVKKKHPDQADSLSKSQNEEIAWPKKEIVTTELLHKIQDRESLKIKLE